MSRLRKIYVLVWTVWLTCFLPIATAHHHEWEQANDQPTLLPAHEDCPICNFTYAGSDSNTADLSAENLYFTEYCYLPEQLDYHSAQNYYNYLLRAPPQL
jgi:hypothetical protein